jgi:hypothetical protein
VILARTIEHCLKFLRFWKVADKICCIFHHRLRIVWKKQPKFGRKGKHITDKSLFLFGVQHALKNLTLPAFLNLFFPILMCLSLAKCPVDKPAEMSHFQLPNETI